MELAYIKYEQETKINLIVEKHSNEQTKSVINNLTWQGMVDEPRNNSKDLMFSNK